MPSRGSIHSDPQLLWLVLNFYACIELLFLYWTFMLVLNILWMDLVLILCLIQRTTVTWLSTPKDTFSFLNAWHNTQVARAMTSVFVWKRADVTVVLGVRQSIVIGTVFMHLIWLSSYHKDTFDIAKCNKSSLHNMQQTFDERSYIILPTLY